MKDFRFSRKDIVRIFEQHELDVVRRIRYAKTGMVNPILFINEKYVLKVNVRDPEIPKLKRECVVMKKLTSIKLPVPELIVFDENKELIPYDFIIMTKLNGKEIHQNWEKISKRRKLKLTHQAGILLSKIHEIEFPKFGDIQNGNGEYKTWSATIFNKLKTCSKDCFDAKLFSKKEIQNIEDIFQKEKKLLDTVKKPRLVHVDYHLGNLLFEKNNITGILDFEWSMSGDTEFDLKNPFTFEGSWQPFLEGYKSCRKLSDEFEEKIRLYNLLMNLELTFVAHQHWGNDSMKWFREKVIQSL